MPLPSGLIIFVADLFSAFLLGIPMASVKHGMGGKLFISAQSK